MPLSFQAVKNAKPREKPYKLTDGQGLYLLVQPSGTKLWRLNYRYAGRHKTLAIGVDPEVGLGEARERREAARKALRDGLDPSALKKAARAATVDPEAPKTERTFEEVGRAWMAVRRKRWTSATSWARVQSLLENDAFPVVGHLAVRSIEPRQMLEM